MITHSKKYRFLLTSSKSLVFLLITMLVSTLHGCVYDKVDDLTCITPMEEVYVSANMVTRAGTINTDNSLYEDRVETVRVLVFDSQTGDLVYNNLLGAFVQNNAVTWIEPFKITAGKRDFFFVANETTADWDVSTTLSGITSRDALFTTPALNQLLYKPDFKPTNKAGNRAFLMTAVYRNINIPNSTLLGAGSESDPYHFLSEGGINRKVELVRTLSKIKITVKNAVIKSNGKYEFDFITKLMLRSVPKYFSLFNTQLFYYPYKTVAEPTWNFFTANLYNPIADNYYFEPSATEDGVLLEENTNELTDDKVIEYSIGGVINIDYVRTLYVPEYLRTYSASETDKGLGLDDAMSLQVSYTPDVFNPSNVVTQRISIDHEDFNRDGTNPDSYKLPGTPNTTYSRYSVPRNTHYDLTTKLREFFIVDFKVSGWEPANLSTLMGYGYTITVDQNGNVIINNTVTACTPHNFVLKTLGATTFKDGTTEKTVSDTEAANLLVGEIASFELINLPNPHSGIAYLEVWYNGAKIHTFKR